MRTFVPLVAFGLTTSCAVSVARIDGGGAERTPPPPIETRPPEEPFHACGHLGFGQTQAVAYAPDGLTVAVGASSGYVKIYDARDGDERAVFTLGSEPVLSVAYSPDGASLAGSDQHGRIAIWRVRDGALVRIIQLPQLQRGIALTFSPDGRTLAAMLDRFVQLWNVDDGSVARTIDTSVGSERTDYGVPGRLLAFSPDGRNLATGGLWSVRIWRVDDGALVRTLLERFDAINAIAFSPDGSALAAIGMRWLRLWRTSDGALITLVQNDEVPGHSNDRLNAMAFAPDGQTLVVGRGYGVDVWHVRTGADWVANPQHTAGPARAPGGPDIGRPVYDMEFARDGRSLLTADSFGTATLWDAQTWRPRVVIAGVVGGPQSMAFTPDGKTLVAGMSFTPTSSLQGVTRLWNVRNGRVIRTWQGTAGIGALTRDGNTILVGTPSPGFAVYSPLDAVTPRMLSAESGVAAAIAIASDGRTVAFVPQARSSTRAPLRVIDLVNGTAIRTLAPSVGDIGALVFDPAGDSLAMASGMFGAGAVSVFALDGSERFRIETPLHGAGTLAFHPAGTLFATAGSHDRSARLWRMDDWAEFATTPPDEGTATSVTFSPDGQIVATGSSASSTQLVRIEDGGVVQTLRGLGVGTVDRIAYSPSGARLAVSHADGTIELWCRP